jgi:hypothetical protein
MAAQNPNNPPQASEPVLQGSGFSVSWYQWFATTVARALLSPATSSVPVSANAPGTLGQMATDGNYLYVYIGTSWKRTALAAW